MFARLSRYAPNAPSMKRAGLTPSLRQENQWSLSQGCRLQSRTTSMCAIFRQRALRKSWPDTRRLTPPLPLNACAAPARSSSEKPTVMSSLWVPQRKTPHSLYPQSSQPRSRPGRLERRIRGQRRFGNVADRAGFGHRRFGPHAGGVLRRRRPETDCTAECLRYGLVAFGSSLDQIGPFSKSVRETAQTLEIMAGFDHFDSRPPTLGSTNT